MKTLKWLFLSCIIFVCCQARAQAKLGITIDSFPSQIVLNDSISYYGSFVVHNYGTEAFNGSFSLNYIVNDTLYNSTTDSGINFPSTSLTIGPDSSSVPQQLIIHGNTGAFSIVGSSGVVIWPISLSATTYDSASVVVEVTFPANLNPISSQNLQVYINQQQLVINTNAQNLLKRVRIYDIQGQLLIEQAVSSSKTIPLNKYAAGCYLAEVILNDNSQHVFKVINMAGR